MLDSIITQQNIDDINHTSLNTDIYQYIGTLGYLSNKPLHWIGSGLAKISASYANDLCIKYKILSHFNSALHYRNYQDIGIPILVSLGGKGDDAIHVAKYMAQHNQNVGLITANHQSSILKIFEQNIISAFLGTYPEKDKRFVNLQGIIALSTFCEKFIHYFCINNTLTPIILNLTNINLITSNICEALVSNRFWQNSIIVLGTGYNSAIEHTWKSIMHESCITHIIWQDIKDYTHGDHLLISQFKNYSFILIENEQTKAYTDIFLERFSTICQVNKITIPLDTRQAFWENLCYVSCLANHLSYYIGYQGKRPPKDPIIYNWRGWGNL